MKTKNKITTYHKIGIINTAFIGDVLLSIFLCQAIKDKHPNSVIYFIASPKMIDLLSHSNAIDKVLPYDKHTKHKGIFGLRELIKKIKEEKIELIFAPHRSARTSLITFFSKPRFSVSYNTSSLKFLYSKTVEYKFVYHEIERNLELLSVFEEFTFPLNLPKVEFKFPETVQKKIVSLIENSFENKNYITIAPGSVWKTKQWKIDGFSFVAKELLKEGFRVVLIGSGTDRLLCDEISRFSGALNLAGETTLLESLFLIKHSRLLITNDSSPTHFASLMNTPCLTIYGPTIPEFGFYPRSQRSRIIQIPELECKPCSIHGYNHCPVKHHNCMNLIDEQDVLKVAKDLLSY